MAPQGYSAKGSRAESCASVPGASEPCGVQTVSPRRSKVRRAQPEHGLRLGRQSGGRSLLAAKSNCEPAHGAVIAFVHAGVIERTSPRRTPSDRYSSGLGEIDALFAAAVTGSLEAGLRLAGPLAGSKFAAHRERASAPATSTQAQRLPGAGDRGS